MKKNTHVLGYIVSQHSNKSNHRQCDIWRDHPDESLRGLKPLEERCHLNVRRWCSCFAAPYWMRVSSIHSTNRTCQWKIQTINKSNTHTKWTTDGKWIMKCGWRVHLSSHLASHCPLHDCHFHSNRIKRTDICNKSLNFICERSRSLSNSVYSICVRMRHIYLRSNNLRKRTKKFISKTQHRDSMQSIHISAQILCGKHFSIVETLKWNGNFPIWNICESHSFMRSLEVLLTFSKENMTW